MEKNNEVRVHKNGDKRNLKKCRPISSLPVAGKTFKRILNNNMYELFTESTEYLLTNQVLNQAVRVLINFCPSLIKFTNLMAMDL